MPRPSTIDLLPEHLREQIKAWINDPGITQLSVVDRTNAIIDTINDARPDGEPLPHVSRSSVNRYAQRYARIGEKMRQSREVASHLMAGIEFDDSSQVDKLIQESVRTLIFDVSSQMAESDDPVSPKVITQLALATKRLQDAGIVREKRERAIRQDEREAAAEKVEALGKSNGLTADTVAAIKAEILGL